MAFPLCVRARDRTDDYIDRGEIFSRESIVSFNRSSASFRDRFVSSGALLLALYVSRALRVHTFPFISQRTLIHFERDDYIVIVRLYSGATVPLTMKISR